MAEALRAGGNVRTSIHIVVVAVILGAPVAFAQQKSTSLIPKPIVVTAAQAVDLAKFDGQLIQLPDATVVHADTANLFLFGEPKGHQAHVVVPAPAIAPARVGDL